MEKKRKYLIICTVFIFLMIPIFLGIYIENIFVQIFDIYTFLFLIGGLTILLLAGELIDIFGFNIESLELIKRHDFIQSLIDKQNRIGILLLFIITMLMEELIFRYYLISILWISLKMHVVLSLFISTISFSLYHIHTWFSFKNLRILVIYLSYSFILGFFNSILFLSFGFLFCVIIHSIIAFLFYFNLYNRYFKAKQL